MISAIGCATRKAAAEGSYIF